MPLRPMIESLFRKPERWSLMCVVILCASLALALLLLSAPGFRIIVLVITIPSLAINFASTAILMFRGRHGTEEIDLFIHDANYLKSYAVFILPMQVFLGMISFLDKASLDSLYTALAGFLLGCSMAAGPGVYFLLWYIKKNGVTAIIRRS